MRKVLFIWIMAALATSSGCCCCCCRCPSSDDKSRPALEWYVHCSQEHGTTGDWCAGPFDFQDSAESAGENHERAVHMGAHTTVVNGEPCSSASTLFYAHCDAVHEDEKPWCRGGASDYDMIEQIATNHEITFHDGKDTTYINETKCP